MSIKAQWEKLGGGMARVREYDSRKQGLEYTLKCLNVTKPAQNARKWFATVEIERASSDLNWLDKAIRIVEKQIQEMNKKQRGKESTETSLVQ